MFLLMLAGIAGRHVFSEALPGVTELPEQLFPWWVMASIVLAARAGAHVAVEAVSLMLAPKAREALSMLVHGVTIAVCVTVVWSIVQVAFVAGGDRSPILGVPLVHLHVALGTAFTLIALLSLCALVEGRR